MAIVVASLLSIVAAADLPPLPKPKCPNPSELKINSSCRIPFENPLPRMRCGKVKCGTYNNMELSLPGVLTTSDARLGMFLQKMRETVMANRRLLFMDGKVIVCNHNWIRDHVHQMKKIVAHILLPDGKTPEELLVNGEETPFAISTVGESRYVDATVAPKDGVADFELPFRAERSKR